MSSEIDLVCRSLRLLLSIELYNMARGFRGRICLCRGRHTIINVRLTHVLRLLLLLGHLERLAARRLDVKVVDVVVVDYVCHVWPILVLARVERVLLVLLLLAHLAGGWSHISS